MICRTSGMNVASTAGDGSSARHSSSTARRSLGTEWMSLQDKCGLSARSPIRIRYKEGQSLPQIYLPVGESLDHSIEICANLHIHIADLCL